MTSHEQTVAQQFDPQSQRYLTSAVHASGPDLIWIDNWLKTYEGPASSALDVGRGPICLHAADSERSGCAARHAADRHPDRTRGSPALRGRLLRPGCDALQRASLAGCAAGAPGNTPRAAPGRPAADTRPARRGLTAGGYALSGTGTDP